MQKRIYSSFEHRLVHGSVLPTRPRWLSVIDVVFLLIGWLLNRPSSSEKPTSPTSPRASVLSLGPVLVVDPNIVDVPTFYQTLSGVTHLNEGEIHQLDKMYYALKANGRFDLSLFASLVCPPIPSAVVINLFQVFWRKNMGTMYNFCHNILFIRSLMKTAMDMLTWKNSFAVFPPVLEVLCLIERSFVSRYSM